MIKIQANELSDLIGPSFSKHLFAESLRIHNISFAATFYYSMDTIDNVILDCCKIQGYDPDHVLVVVGSLTTISENDDSFFFQGSISDRGVCCIIPNMTTEKLAKMVRKIMNNKAFL